MTTEPPIDETHFKFIARLQEAKARAEAFDSHQRAVAGLETGDGNRHDHKNKDKALLTKQGKIDVSDLTTLEQALLNPVYAAAYEEVTSLLDRAAVATVSAIETAQKALADMMDKAVRLPDGTAVFRDENGDVYTVDGTKLDDDIAAGIQWPDGTPSYQDYLKQRKALDDLLVYQVDVIGRYQDKLADPNYVPTPDEIEAITGVLIARSPASIRDEIRSPDTEPPNVAGDNASDVSGPPI